MKFRAENPAMWRGKAQFHTLSPTPDTNILVVTKTDETTGNQVLVIFSDNDYTLPLPQTGTSVKLNAWVPEFIKIK